MPTAQHIHFHFHIQFSVYTFHIQFQIQIRSQQQQQKLQVTIKCHSHLKLVNCGGARGGQGGVGGRGHGHYAMSSIMSRLCCSIWFGLDLALLLQWRLKCRPTDEAAAAAYLCIVFFLCLDVCVGSSQSWRLSLSFSTSLEAEEIKKHKPKFPCKVIKCCVPFHRCIKKKLTTESKPTIAETEPEHQVQHRVALFHGVPRRFFR